MKLKIILIALIIIFPFIPQSRSDVPLYVVAGIVKYVNGTGVCDATVYVKDVEKNITKITTTSCRDEGYYFAVFDSRGNEFEMGDTLFIEAFKGNLYGSITSTFTNISGKGYKWINITILPNGTNAFATGPKGISNKKDIVITYTYTGHPNYVSIYYSNDENETWHLAGNDSSLDGKYNFTLPKDGKYGFIAVAIGGGSNESIPQPGEKAESYFYLLDSVPPTIKIKYPENNSYVKGGSLLIRWIANDDIDTSLNIKMQYRMEGYWIWSQPKQLPNNGSYEWNMPPFPDKSKIVLRLTAEDDAGNNEYDDIHITIDDVAPTTTLQHGTPYYNGYITSSTPLYINASDEGAGIKEIHYIIDGVENIAYNNISFTIPTEGNHTIEYYSIDAVGNEEQHHIATYYVDDVAPTTTLQHGTLYYNGYITSSTPLYINASDEGAGIKEIHYIIDGVEKAAYGNVIFNLSGYSDGWHTIKYYSIDNLGNIESMHNISYYLDNTPPETSIVLNPSMPNGNNGWYISNVMINISSVDNGTGVNKTYYSIDGREFEEYNATITISQDGIHKIKYYSIDNLGNVEGIKSITIKIDKTKPTIYDNTISKKEIIFNATVYDENVTVFVEFWNSSIHQNVSMEKHGERWIKEEELGGVIHYIIKAVDEAGNWNFTGEKIIRHKNDTIPPRIENVSFQSKSYGMINITCVAIDNIGIGRVWIYIMLPDGSSINESMRYCNEMYYYNASFNLTGNYSFYIYAIDTSKNENISGIMHFEIYPKWDANMDNKINILDLIKVAMHFGSYEGDSNYNASVDINGDGVINILDLIMVAIHWTG